MLNTKSVKEIINHLKSKDLSIKEVIQFYFDNIDKFNPITNSIVSMKDKNEIFNEAEKKKDSELCGLPIAIKDLSDVVGFPTTYGYSGAKNNKPNKNPAIGFLTNGKATKLAKAKRCRTPKRIYASG